MASAPKSNAVYTAFGAAAPAGRRDRLADAAGPHPQRADAADEGRSATARATSYDPNTEEGFSGQNYFPDGVERRVFYAPKGEGAEAEIKERLARWAAMREGQVRRRSMDEAPSGSPPPRPPSCAGW